MKVAVAIFLCALAAFSQDNTRSGRQSVAGMSPSCGLAETSYKVRLDESRHKLEPTEEGKARIYFIHEAGLPSARLVFAYPTSKFAIDGEWVGANHGDSYFSIAVDPGEHHLCAELQSSVVDGRRELAHLSVEAGKSYYYRTRLVLSGSVELLELQPIDSDQGKYLVGIYPLSIPKLKK